MQVERWDVPVQATWQQSNMLVDLNYDIDGLDIIVAEEDTRQRWNFAFEDLVAFKVISGDHAKWSMQAIPPDGGFFEITESPWITALGLVESDEQDEPHHYVICCRRELIEVVAFGVSIESI